jgi:hypothetical protein
MPTSVEKPLNGKSEPDDRELGFGDDFPGFEPEPEHPTHEAAILTGDAELGFLDNSPFSEQTGNSLTVSIGLRREWLPDAPEQIALQDAATGTDVDNTVRLPPWFFAGVPNWLKRVSGETVTDPIRGVRLVNDPEYGYSLSMQNPDTISRFLAELVNADLETWPDQIMLSGLPQVPAEQTDEPPTILRLSVSGPNRRRQAETIRSKNKEVTLFERVETEFVLVVNYDKGSVAFERWDPKRHGQGGKEPYGDLPALEMTPAEVIREGVEKGFWGIIAQFRDERKKKGGASKRAWPTGNHPAPVIHSLKNPDPSTTA